MHPAAEADVDGPRTCAARGIGMVEAAQPRRKGRNQPVIPLAIDLFVLWGVFIQGWTPVDLCGVLNRTLGSGRGGGVAYGARTRNLRSHNPMLCH